MEEVPALVEADLEAPQSLLVFLGCLASRLLLEELVLLTRQLIDPLDDLLIVHDTPPSSLVRKLPGRPARPHLATRGRNVSFPRAAPSRPEE